MRIVFFGTSEFAVPILRVISEHVVLVVTQPDRPSGRGLKTQPSPVKLAALELEIPVETPERSRSADFVQRLQLESADVNIVAAYGQILSQAVLDSARRGSINLHGSILPKYRGAAPIQRSLLAGDTETGVTMIQMDKGMDTGDMIAIRKTLVDPNETYGELHERLADIAADLTGEWIHRIYSGEYPRTPQDHEQATHAAKIEKAEGEIQVWNDAQTEFNRFRGVTPNPGAYLNTEYGRWAIRKANLVECSAEPGTWLASGGVALKDGGLELIEVQPEGKKRMSGKDLANGLRIKAGQPICKRNHE